MSGDVQPRKRKDKKRKREDESVPLSFLSKDLPEDVNIHVHKEEGTGGGICAKIVFFILFSALIVLIGLIITEHRGLTDLDVAESESRYSQIFEGWIDNDKHDDHHTLDDHDNEHFDDEEDEHGDGHTLDDHDDEHIDDEPSEEQEHTLDDHDNEHFDDNDESTPLSQEDVEETNEESTENQIKYRIKSGRSRYRREVSDEDENVTESQQEDDEDVTESQQEDDENVTESQQEDDEDVTESQQEDDEDATESQQEDVTESQQEDDEDVTESQQDDDEDVTESQQDETEEEEVMAESETREEDVSEIEENEEDDDNATESLYPEDDEEEREDMTAESEAKDDIEETHSEHEDQVVSEENLDENEVSEEKKDEEQHEDSREGRETTEQTEKYEDTSDENQTIIEEVVYAELEEAEKEESSDDAPQTAGVTDNLGSLTMIVKTIIGAAILAVGHFVLVKKWKSDSSDEDTKGDLEKEELHIDLSRRNTLVPPPPLQEIEQDVEYANEEYSDDEEGPSKREEYGVVTNIVKEKYEQLRSSYSRSISPESDYGGEDEKPRSDDEVEIEELEEEEIEEEEDVSHEEEIDDANQGEIEEDEEDYEEEEEEYEEEDDEELMKKLEAKYGKLNDESKGRAVSPDQEESDSEKLSDDNNDYEYSAITNEDDWHIHEDLDEAQKKLPNNAAKALKMFEKILEKYPSSPRGLYGLARALDALAEIEKSNKLLEEAVENYLKISDLESVPDELYRVAMERCIDRLSFRGRYGKAVTVHFKLMERFPKESKYRNQLAITYLTIGRIQQARSVLEETLKKWPNDGCALVHYGFIWKTTDNDLKKGVYYMRKGIETKDPCCIDGRFFFHLGDALFRLGRKAEALKLYEDGVEHKLFPSKYQRSLYNVADLTARPWWEENQLKQFEPLFKDLVKNWQVIRNEGLSVLNEKGYFQDESENLRNTGEWKQFELFARGRKNTKNCQKTPFTCKIIGSHPDASGCRRGQTKFSVMHPGTHVWAHCGPTNCRLRVHLGLKVPASTFIRVGDEVRSWEDGKLLIFDDSFEHEVWHNGTATRLVLIVDIWHPDLSITERETLSSL